MRPVSGVAVCQAHGGVSIYFSPCLSRVGLAHGGGRTLRLGMCSGVWVVHGTRGCWFWRVLRIGGCNQRLVPGLFEGAAPWAG